MPAARKPTARKGPAKKPARSPSARKGSGSPQRADVKPAKAKAAPTKPAARPAAPPTLLKPGDPAPDVTLWDQDGKEFRLRDHRGKRVVLYFYPADMTSGCTTQACGLRDVMPRIEREDAVVIGVSPDDAASHRKFIARHGLNFPLAFDPSNQALEAFGVWQEKNMYGRRYMGVVRSTFLLSPEGRIEQAWYRVKPDAHAQQVLDALGA